MVMTETRRGSRRGEDPISRTKTLCRRMAQQGLRSTVVDPQMTAMEMQQRSVHTDNGDVA